MFSDFKGKVSSTSLRMCGLCAAWVGRSNQQPPAHAFALRCPPHHHHTPHPHQQTQQAIEYVKVAVAEDEAGNYDKALQQYKAALEYFSAHLKYEKNPRSAEAIKAKMLEYIERAEYLKTVIGGQKEAAAAASGPNGAAAATAGSKKGDSSDDKERERLKGQLGSAIMSGESGVVGAQACVVGWVRPWNTHAGTGLLGGACVAAAAAGPCMCAARASPTHRRLIPPPNKPQTEKPNVKWDDVAGLEGAKEALKEAVILPVKFPQFFTGVA